MSKQMSCEAWSCLPKLEENGENNMSLQQPEQTYQAQHSSRDFVLPFRALHRDMLALVGGKAANLGELTNAKLPVPPGFCVTTTAYALVAADAGLQSVLDTHATSQAGEGGDAQRLTDMAQAARHCILAATIPTEIADAITGAYGVLGSGEPLPVAVRSSATAEDLPFASFAGQQDTYLNIVGVEAVLDAVRRCWASLWTDRAVSYRERLGLDQSSVKLAVVVQRMIESSVAGVLFTAHPVTGKRRQAVIDANPGLGEAVVSGATNPDHFVVQTTTGEIVERRLGDKQVMIQAEAFGGIQKIEAGASPALACLSDDQIRALAALGARVEALYETPQDIEWAIDPSGQVFLLQTRPITTLFPLPAEAPSTDESLRVYLAFGVQQGTYRPFTPMGRSALRLLASGFLTLIGFPLCDPLAGPRFVAEAASRPFFEVTAAFRSPFGRGFLLEGMQEAEVQAATSFEHL